MGSNEEQKKKHVFTWKIENFSMCSKRKGEVLFSPSFKAKSFDETSWIIKFYPGGNKYSLDGYISCFLIRKDDDSIPLSIECDFSFDIINKNGQTVLCNRTKHNFEKGICWGFRNYMKLEEVEKTAVYEDTLVIQCTLSGNILKEVFFSQNNSITKFKVNKHSFQWVVNISNFNTRKEVIKFPCSGTLQVEITLHIPEDDVKICILIDENFFSSRYMVCNFALLDAVGEEQDSRQATHLFEKAEKWEFPNFIKKSQLKSGSHAYLKNNCFTLKCEISVSDGTIEESVEKSFTGKFPTSDMNTIAILNEDIKRLYKDKILTDVKLQVEEQSFSAHKCLLSSRSPVFFAMFDLDMAESRNGEVHIPDLDAKTMALFLDYIYTGTVDSLDYENALKLIMAADKYQVLSLKNKCAELLASKLSDANVCEILVTADLVGLDSLKAFALDRIKRQPKKLFDSEEWKHCIRNNLDLATETVSEVSKFWSDQTNHIW